MQLNITYDISATRLVHEREMREKLPLMRRAGVETLYIFGYFYGHFASSEADMAEAHRILTEEGFRTGVIHLPVGHGGNALDPNDLTLDIAIAKHWHGRTSEAGEELRTAACIDEVMTADVLAANRTVMDMGYRRIIHDDDLRYGKWGEPLRGCYCERCMAKFARLVGRPVASAEIADERNAELREMWTSFQCERMIDFLRDSTPDGLASGIMVMHNGDRRHGLDIPLIRYAMPEDFMLRVGEGHFTDRAFLHPLAEASLEASILTHLARFGDVDRCYSESTVYPANALSPDNWIRKMEIEIRCGLRNLYLMSGTWFFSDPYWHALAENLPRLRDLAAAPTPPPEELPFIWQID